MNVIPNLAYHVRVEIQRTDTDGSNEHADITIDGKRFGRCNPTGSNDCGWHDCSSSNSMYVRDFFSNDGVVDFRASYSRDVDSGGRLCTYNGISTYGIARVTLTPKNGNVIFSY